MSLIEAVPASTSKIMESMPPFVTMTPSSIEPVTMAPEKENSPVSSA